MAGNKALIDSVYNSRLEVHYNSWFIRDRDNRPIKLELQGKIKCPLINAQISSLVCSKIMERTGWPRAIDETVCKRCECYVSLSINKFKSQKDKTNERRNTEPRPTTSTGSEQTKS